MALKRQHDALSMYSMASMTDVIFLLLIFFMVTSTFMSPSALEVNLPQSSQNSQLKPSTRIYIDENRQMWVTQSDSIKESEPVAMPVEQLEGFLQSVKMSAPADQQFVALHADEAVPYGSIVDVLDLGSRVGLKIVLATKPTDRSAAAAALADAKALANEAAAGIEQPAASNEPAPTPETQQ